MTPKAQVTKEKIDILDYFKFKTLCFNRHYLKNEKTIYRMGKIFANHMFVRGLRFRIHKELTTQDLKELTFKTCKRFEQTFLQ